MNIEITSLPSGKRIMLDGRLDLAGCQKLDKEMVTLLTAGHVRLIFDCSALTHISSMGLRSILTAAKKVDKAGGKIVFQSPPSTVLQIFELAGFDHLFTTCDTLEASIAALD